jgi:radical SAM superfamily enzyme YgiQ (UPF0313 family)
MRALLINPYIYDFAAYNFWSAPLGLLYVGSVLRKNTIDIQLIDCLRVVEKKRKVDGRAPFIKEKADMPCSLKDVKKRFRRYGISKETFAQELAAIEAPDLILITSIMTYWYSGTKDVLEIARTIFPQSKIVIGGIYPSLCFEHSLKEMKKADLIVRHIEINRFYNFVEEAFSISLPFKPSMYDLDALPYPCFDLYGSIPFIPLLTSYGCAYKCTYCATPYMHPRVVRRSSESVLNEIKHWYDRGVTSYVIYDDNFLYKKDLYAKPLLRDIARLPFSVSIYNPNAINAALIDEEVANLLFLAGFKDIRIGFETINPIVQKETGGKVDANIFESAIRHLFAAGFSADSISTYVLAGLPFQPWEDVKNVIDYLTDLGTKIHIAEYTPIPHTPMFDKFSIFARFPIVKEPLYQNNALHPFAWEGFTDNDLAFLKRYARGKTVDGNNNKKGA